MCDVLLLEDDPLLRSLISQILAEQGLWVREAANVPDAQSVLQDPKGCRLLVADHDLGNLQDLDGFAFAVRAMRLLPALRVIYVTGKNELIAGRALTPRERALAKPFPARHLLELTREMLLN